jgi:hypothetical protein
MNRVPDLVPLGSILMLRRNTLAYFWEGGGKFYNIGTLLHTEAVELGKALKMKSFENFLFFQKLKKLIKNNFLFLFRKFFGETKKMI